MECPAGPESRGKRDSREGKGPRDSRAFLEDQVNKLITIALN